MNFIGLLRTLEVITRSPRMGHDVDVEDGAEHLAEREPGEVPQWYRDGHERDMRQANKTIDRLNRMLAEREAETECLVPEDLNTVCRCAACVAEERAAEDELAADDSEKDEGGFECMACGALYSKSGDHDCAIVADDSPNPTEPWEPELNSSERVAVRQLIEERFGDQTANSDAEDADMWRAVLGAPHIAAVETGHDMGLSAAAELFPQHTKSSPADLLTAGSGPSEVSGHSPVPPSEGRPDPAEDRVQRLGQWLKAMARNDRSPEDIVHGFVRLYSLIQPNPDDAAAEWIGEAVPVISEVLGAHRPFQRRPIMSEDDGCVYCSDEGGHIHSRYRDYETWLEHAAPILANALAPQPK